MLMSLKSGLELGEDHVGAELRRVAAGVVQAEDALALVADGDVVGLTGGGGNRDADEEAVVGVGAGALEVEGEAAGFADVLDEVVESRFVVDEGVALLNLGRRGRRAFAAGRCAGGCGVAFVDGRQARHEGAELEVTHEV